MNNPRARNLTNGLIAAHGDRQKSFNIQPFD